MPDDLLPFIGARVRRLREAAGVSQEAFARSAGMDRAYLGRVERGTQNLSLTTAARLASALGVSLSDMFEGAPLPPASER